MAFAEGASLKSNEAAKKKAAAEAAAKKAAQLAAAQAAAKKATVNEAKQQATMTGATPTVVAPSVASGTLPKPATTTPAVATPTPVATYSLPSVSSSSRTSSSNRASSNRATPAPVTLPPPVAAPITTARGTAATGMSGSYKPDPYFNIGNPLAGVGTALSKGFGTLSRAAERIDPGMGTQMNPTDSGIDQTFIQKYGATPKTQSLYKELVEPIAQRASQPSVSQQLRGMLPEPERTYDPLASVRGAIAEKYAGSRLGATLDTAEGLTRGVLDIATPVISADTLLKGGGGALESADVAASLIPGIGLAAGVIGATKNVGKGAKVLKGIDAVADVIEGLQKINKTQKNMAAFEKATTKTMTLSEMEKLSHAGSKFRKLGDDVVMLSKDGKTMTKIAVDTTGKGAATSKMAAEVKVLQDELKSARQLPKKYKDTPVEAARTLEPQTAQRMLNEGTLEIYKSKEGLTAVVNPGTQFEVKYPVNISKGKAGDKVVTAGKAEDTLTAAKTDDMIKAESKLTPEASKVADTGTAAVKTEKAVIKKADSIVKAKKSEKAAAETVEAIQDIKKQTALEKGIAEAEAAKHIETPGGQLGLADLSTDAAKAAEGVPMSGVDDYLRAPQSTAYTGGVVPPASGVSYGGYSGPSSIGGGLSGGAKAITGPTAPSGTFKSLSTKQKLGTVAGVAGLGAAGLITASGMRGGAADAVVEEEDIRTRHGLLDATLPPVQDDAAMKATVNEAKQQATMTGATPTVVAPSVASGTLPKPATTTPQAPVTPQTPTYPTTPQQGIPGVEQVPGDAGEEAVNQGTPDGTIVTWYAIDDNGNLTDAYEGLLIEGKTYYLDEYGELQRVPDGAVVEAPNGQVYQRGSETGLWDPQNPYIPGLEELVDEELDEIIQQNGGYTLENIMAVYTPYLESEYAKIDKETEANIIKIREQMAARGMYNSDAALTMEQQAYDEGEQRKNDLYQSILISAQELSMQYGLEYDKLGLEFDKFHEDVRMNDFTMDKWNREFDEGIRRWEIENQLSWADLDLKSQRLIHDMYMDNRALELKMYQARQSGTSTAQLQQEANELRQAQLLGIVQDASDDYLKGFDIDGILSKVKVFKDMGIITEAEYKLVGNQIVNLYESGGLGVVQ